MTLKEVRRRIDAIDSQLVPFVLPADGLLPGGG